jgi:hypothetical protein
MLQHPTACPHRKAAKHLNSKAAKQQNENENETILTYNLIERCWTKINGRDD